MEPITFRQTSITGGFWQKRQEQTRSVTVDAVLERFTETGRFEAMACKWAEGMPHQPHIFWDSDVAKWIESASYLLETERNPKWEAVIEDAIDQIEKNRDEHGYFNICFTVCEPENRFKKRTEHELYCAGHLIEAAIAYFHATKKDRFLKAMCKYADYIETIFVKEAAADFTTPGHPEIELALVRLYRCTGEKRYLQLAKFFIDKRGTSEKDTFYDFANARYDQTHLPVREQETAEGHSVRACYLYAAMADLAKEYGDKGLQEACCKLFDNMTERRMYITGGIGQSNIGEAFTVDYDLPNRTSYAETCAAISLAFFAQRMLLLDVNAKYADVIERLFYNGILSGISLDGKSFFYENALEINRALRGKDASVVEGHRSWFPAITRSEVFGCSCCPPNLSRLFASLSDYIYTKDDDTYFVHQFIESTFKDGSVTLTQKTNFPASGTVKLRTAGIKKLAFRIPYWCKKLTVNATYTEKNGYAYVSGLPECLEIAFLMTPTLIKASEHVQENCGRVALQLGPIIYCLEGIDNGENLRSLWIDKTLQAHVSYDPFFGANVITAKGFKQESNATLYAELTENFTPVDLKFIPYFAFANRGESDMLIWTNYR